MPRSSSSRRRRPGPALRGLGVAALFALASPSLARADEPRSVMLGAGIGLGELVHAELGYFATPRTLIEARAGWFIFNPMVGLALTHAWGHAGEGPPRHGWLLRGELMLNPTLDEFHFEERGEEVGGYVGTYAGYAFVGDSGFYFRALGGAVFGKENDYIGPMGPNVTLTFGTTF
jgi:hypothetical protein